MGLLNREPLTGYEIKKIIQRTPFLYWSGNNNQVYKAFAELLDEGWVAKEVRHQAGAPSKNIYTITGDGLHELKRWLLHVADEPVFRKQVLIKLALAGPLKRRDLDRMMDAYAEVVNMEAAAAERELETGYFAEQASVDGETFLDLIRDNIRTFYASELEWIRKVKAFIAKLPEDESIAPNTGKPKSTNKAGSVVNHQIQEHQGRRYLHFTGSGSLFQREQDASDIIERCMEQDVNAVVLEGRMLADEFINLRTGLAGIVIQKLANYNIKAAVVIDDGQNFPARFQEMVSELSAGNTFRLFNDVESAVNWLLR